jgi:hypothetical protein
MSYHIDKLEERILQIITEADNSIHHSHRVMPSNTNVNAMIVNTRNISKEACLALTLIGKIREEIAQISQQNK